MKLHLTLSVLGLALILGACAHNPPTMSEETPAYNATGYWNPRDPASDSDTGREVYALDTFGKKKVDLERCSGSAQLVEEPNHWVVRIRNADCANIEVNGAKSKMHGEGNGNRQFDVALKKTESTQNHKIVISSNSGKNVDTLRIAIRPNIPTAVNGQWVLLSDCGGYAQVVVQNGQVNLKFKEVSRCDLFDIVGDNGDTTVYPAKDFSSNASFTLPKRVMEYGYNKVLVQVRNKRNTVEDKFYVAFLAM